MQTKQGEKEVTLFLVALVLPVRLTPMYAYSEESFP